MSMARYGHTATALLDGTVLVSGGGTDSPYFTPFSTCERYTLAVAPTVTSPNAVTFGVGATNTFTVTASGANPAPARLTEVGALPGGVTFVDQGNGTALLSGTPAAGTK